MSAAGTGRGRLLAIVASVAAVATVVAALVVMDPPAAQREMRIDQKRVRELHRIEAAAHQYLEEHGRLPADLATLAARPGLRLAVEDPVDGSVYGYEVTGPRSLRLCAGFATDSARGASGSGFYENDGWYHPAGHHCFERKFDETPEK